MPTLAQRRVVDPILTNVVQGYVHPEHVGMHLFPRVPVNVAGGKVIEFNKESFRLYNTQRAPGTPAKRIKFGYEGKPYALENHALEALVPKEHMREAEQVPGIDLASRSTKLTMDAELLGLEVQQATLATTLANYDANNRVTLSGTDQWNDYSNSDPKADIKAAREAVRSKIGVYPNVMVISAKAFNELSDHPAVLEKIKYTQAAIITPDLLAKVFDLDKVVVGKGVYSDDSGAFVDIWGVHVVLAYVPKSIAGAEQPSYGFTYTMRGHPMVEKPYFEEPIKSWVYGVHDERIPVLSGMEGGFFIQNAVAAP